jgi:mono/diheme cytochrome c family protein
MPAIVGIVIGVGLLVLLAFGVAYASGWSARPARAEDEDLPGALGMERKAQAAIALTAGIGVVLLVYGLSEPQRQAAAVERQRHQSEERGAHLFASLCYTCHNYNGQGAVVPGQGVMAANLTALRAKAHLGQPPEEYQQNLDADKATWDRVTKTIARGRNLMPAWGQRDGGALNDAEIKELATFIMYGNWGEIRGLVAAGAPTPELPDAGGTGAEAVARSLFLSKGCGACHTIDAIAAARGVIGPNLNNLGQVAGTRKPGMDAKAYIRESILQPAAFLSPGYQNLMLPFTEVNTPTSGNQQLTPQELNDLVDYLSTLGAR